MNIQQLEYIIAVDTHRHFVKASEKCFITQATLSMMIKKLEEELDVKIQAGGAALSANLKS